MSKNSVLAVLCGVIAMTVLDLSVVNVALPSIQRDLHADAADLQWVIVAYGIGVAGFLLLGGRLGDLLGHRRVLLVGIAGLGAASLLGGLSGSLVVLVAARAAQGVGAALAAPNALAIVSTTFAEGAERNRALGIFGAAGGTSAIAGSIVGGTLVQGPGWPWVFFVNVPLGLVLIGLVVTRVPADRGGATGRRVDLAGAGTLTAGLVAVAFGVHESVDAGWWAVPTLGALVTGLLVLAAFGALEARVRTPLIPLSTLRRPTLLWAEVAAGLMWASFLGLIYAATLFVQQVLRWSPLAAGSSTIPIAVVSLGVSALGAPRLIARIGAATTFAVGMLVLGLGVLLLVRVSARAGYLIDIAPAYCVVGAGLGLAQVAVQIAAFAGVEAGEAGLAGGAVETAREMGGALGLALIVSVALHGADGLTAQCHRSVLAAAVFAAASALVAMTLLRRSEVAAVAVDTTALPPRVDCCT